MSNKSEPAAASGDAVSFTFENCSIVAEHGASIAAALANAGVPDFTRGKTGEERGLYCGMGACQDCLVTVNGKTGLRACMTKIEAGMAVSRAKPRPAILDPDIADLAQPPEALDVRETELLVIGGGPGGLMAAETAARAGLRVLLLDERALPGGQYFKQPVTDHAGARLANDNQANNGKALIAAARRAGVVFSDQTLVWGAEREDDGTHRIGAFREGKAFYVKPRMIVIATGAYERAPAITGWTLPGAMTAGAAQTLLRAYGTLPGKRILIAGNGPLNIQIARELKAAGAEIVGLVEAANAPWLSASAGMKLMAADPAMAIAGVRQIAALMAGGVKIEWSSRVKEICGNGKVESVTVETPAGRKMFDVDTVLIGGYFTPANELSRLLGCAHDVVDGALVAQREYDGATSLDHVHIVGEAGRFGGAPIALAEGELAGRSVALKLGRKIAGDSTVQKKRRIRQRAFQDALWAVFRDENPKADRGLDDATVICRCEGVTYGQVRSLTGEFAPDISTLKRLTRAGMGRCQGRFCAHTLAVVSGQGKSGSETRGFNAPQMPLRPLPLAALGVEKPEWGGHKRALLPDLEPLENNAPLPAKNADVVVIGAGIAGVSTALFLARAGVDVVIVERAFSNNLASGGNAGSLHAQLLSFDHGAKAEAGGGPAAKTLPLQRDSIEIWKALQQETGKDFEMKVTGGLMVAETEAHLRFLEEKTDVERAYGIDCQVIDRNTLRDMEPALNEMFIGAAFCAQEGKINPLVATQHVLDAALQAGAKLFDRTAVTAIEDDHDGYSIKTSRGVIRAKRVVNAAGAFASRVGQMVGLEVPVFGAPLQMLVTEAAEPAVSTLIAHADRHLTLKQAANGNFLIGGGWTAGLDPVHQHPRPMLNSMEGNAWVAQHVVPGLRKLHLIRSWAAMNINIDGAPILGEAPSRRGFFNAVTSNGYTLGPIVGQITADLITGRETGRSVETFSLARF
ncbi:FAD-dependent oxidoreductase [Martelella mediterranea]|uniref:Glycine/D-amino acid oxidase-like deaminating enzyme n=1 Tax=Martelella mediterranea TaxID=293089 RepID=A0A4R3NN30_9HYPH|nr:FAD-dependent oxidoreductase [Martelella mediterranea]TCT36275.1 glycine/D-amino acid oxidase-like deaminating enzyme [Martelella mediterranea]